MDNLGLMTHVLLLNAQNILNAFERYRPRVMTSDNDLDLLASKFLETLNVAIA